MTGKIVVATDGSETGNRAVELAAEMSGKLGHELCIVHVIMHGRPAREIARMAEIEGVVEGVLARGVDPGGQRPATLSDLFEQADDEIALARLTNAIGETVIAAAKSRAEDAGAQKVTTQLCAGDYADEILDVADAEDAVFIVVGRRGLGRVREMLLGSVSQKVLHHAPCTVIVVR